MTSRLHDQSAANCRPVSSRFSVGKQLWNK